MDFLAKLPEGHSLKPERPTVAHSLGLGGSSPYNGSPSSLARNKPLNYHYAQPQSVPAAQIHQSDSPWITSNKHYGLHSNGSGLALSPASRGPRNGGLAGAGSF